MQSRWTCTCRFKGAGADAGLCLTANDLLGNGQVKFQDFKLVDNMRCGGEIVDYNGPREAAGFRNALIVAHSSLAPDPLPHSLRDSKDPDIGHSVGLWTSGISFNLTFDTLTFVNFDRSDVQAWSNCAHCNFPNTKYNEGKTTYVKNIRSALRSCLGEMR